MQHMQHMQHRTSQDFGVAVIYIYIYYIYVSLSHSGFWSPSDAFVSTKGSVLEIFAIGSRTLEAPSSGAVAFGEEHRMGALTSGCNEGSSLGKKHGCKWDVNWLVGLGQA